MKLNGIGGTGTGKLGNQVFAVRAGEQIVRQYQPNVSNPSTPLQVANRSKLKLMSQLASVVAPVLAIKSQGLKSSRNLFIKQNYDLSSYSNQEAAIALNRVQLTKSNVGIAGFSADRTSPNGVVVKMNSDLSEAFDRIVYIAFEKQDDGSLRLLDSKVVTEAGQNGDYQSVLTYTEKAMVMYAYGMRDNTENAKARFGNLQAPSAENIAKLIVTSQDILSDVTISETKGLTLGVGETEGDSDDVENIAVYLVISGNGSASGAGRYEIGQLVRLVATPDEEASFVAWKENDINGRVLSTSPIYTFEAETSIHVCAVFEGGPVPHYDIIASVNPSGSGSIIGDGNFAEGEEVVLRALPNEGFRFIGWYENNQLVSTSQSLQFYAQSNRTLQATFEALQQYTISLNANPVGDGTVSGGGTFYEGTEITCVATPAAGLSFEGWYENNVKVSNSSSYSFIVANNRTLEARFTNAPAINIVSASVNSQNVVDNSLQINTGNVNLAVEVNTTLQGAYALVSKTDTMPEVGSDYHASEEIGSVENTTSVSKTVYYNTSSKGKHWFILVKDSLIIAVHPYYFEVV